MTKARGAANRGLIGSIGWAGADAIGRLVLLSGATILLSRLLTADDFGISAIILAISSAASLVVGASFEDALTQKKVMRQNHLRAAWAYCLAASAILLVLSLLLGPLLAGFYREPGMALLLPVAMVAVFFVGHGDLVTARARRLRRFNTLAAARLFSHVIAAPVAVAAAVLGAGVWSLIVLRLVAVVAESVILQVRIGFPLMPRFSRAHLGELRRFASFSLLDRLADNLNYLLFNNLVGIFFGVTVLGYVNMAMRLIEPIRGAVLTTMHNLSFPHFRKASNTNGLAGSRDMLIRVLGFVCSATFAGLAVVTPVLLPLVTGPGWEASVPIGVAFALGAAFVLPSQSIYSCLTASGRPEYSLSGNLTKLVFTALALILLRDSPPEFIGLARFAGDLAQAFLVLCIPLGAVHWPPLNRWALLTPAWLISAAMASLATLILLALMAFDAIAALAGAVIAGVAVQVLLMAWFQREVVAETMKIFGVDLRAKSQRAHQ